MEFFRRKNIYPTLLYNHTGRVYFESFVVNVDILVTGCKAKDYQRIKLTDSLIIAINYISISNFY